MYALTIILGVALLCSQQITAQSESTTAPATTTAADAPTTSGAVQDSTTAAPSGAKCTSEACCKELTTCEKCTANAGCQFCIAVNDPKKPQIPSECRPQSSLCRTMKVATCSSASVQSIAMATLAFFAAGAGSMLL